MKQELYLGLDAHASFCVLAAMNARGQSIRSRSSATSEAALIREVRSIRAKPKFLALEESSLAGWIAGALQPYVDQIIFCDPRHNALISRGGKKDDLSDAIKAVQAAANWCRSITPILSIGRTSSLPVSSICLFGPMR
ncbi:MAG: hypothetical protein OXI38_05910 [Bacteroidota bacterium]|nr:hypothetical protein [Bacteroidota bacterium]